jgi:hypothetical protein
MEIAVEPMKAEYAVLYRLCFSSPPFCKGYCGDERVLDYSEIQDISLKEYNDVNRFIILKSNDPIAFFHLWQKQDGHYLTGGVRPNCPVGTGPRLMAIALDHSFNVLEVQTLHVEIYSHNLRSQRMSQAFGFKVNHTIITNDVNRRVYSLGKTEFPNSFTENLLKKYHEKK